MADRALSRPAGSGTGALKHQVVPALVAVTAWLLAVASLVLLVAARPPVDENLWFYLVDFTVAVVYGTVASVILSRRWHVVPWLLALASLGGAVAAIGYALSAWGLQLAERGRTMPFEDVVDRLNGIAWVPGTMALFLVIPWLVGEHRKTWYQWAGLATGTLITLVLTGQRVLELDDNQGPWYAAAVIVGLLAAADAAWRRYRGPLGERLGLGWLAVGTTVMALSFLPLAFATVAEPVAGLPLWFTPSLHVAAQAIFPAAVLVAVLRQRMWGLDLPVSRAVLAGLLTLLLIVVYVMVTSVVASLVPGSGAAQLVAAAVVVALMQPSRSWLQVRVDHLVRGETARPERVVRRMGTALGRARTADELLAGLVQSVGEALRLESVAVHVGDGTGLPADSPPGAPAAVWGVPTSPPLTVPLETQGEVLGRLEVTAPPGESLDTRDRRALDELAGVVAAGVALARATDELERARDRLTVVRLEERRLLRRELHDGLGPSLAGVRLGLSGARNLLERDPAAAGELLSTLQAELDQRVDDVRALSHSLLPPALDDLGLEVALEELAARHRMGGLEVSVACSGAGGLEPVIAVAVYGIVVEAVTNVSRHSGSAVAFVTVDVGESEVTVTIDDAGTGIADGAVPGVGTRSMRERAEEQGGTVRVLALEGGGTRVAAALPVGSR